MKAKQIIMVAAIFGALAIALGAFGAHALKQTLADLGTTDTYNTAAKYHLVMSVALFGLGLLALFKPAKPWGVVALLWTAGILIFAGTLYVLSVTGIKWLGAITPIGGASLILGWGLLAYHANKQL